jgi:8-oxo-dGTP pyrophosphatase MutT (NUDIX family)
VESSVEILLFQHPSAGIQFPSGTVETGEDPQEAALREVFEETGLTQVNLDYYLGARIEAQPGCVYTLKTSRVFSRPDPASFDWATLNKGLQVRLLRQQGNFMQVSYEEQDRFLEPQYISYQITGWLPADCLASQIRRHLFHLTTDQATPASWVNFADHHLFRPFWARLDKLPEIVWPQSELWRYANQELGYNFNRR